MSSLPVGGPHSSEDVKSLPLLMVFDLDGVALLTWCRFPTSESSAEVLTAYVQCGQGLLVSRDVTHLHQVIDGGVSHRYCRLQSTTLWQSYISAVQVSDQGG